MDKRKTAEAVELLFRYYTEESFYEEQWGTADDLAEEFLKCAKKGQAYIQGVVMDNLDYDLTFGQDKPETDEVIKQRMLDKLNGHAKAQELAEAAVLVWIKL